MTHTLRFDRIAGLFLLSLAVGCTVGAEEGDPAPDDGADGGAVALCSPSNVTTTVIAARCTGGACHDAEAPAAGLDLASAGVADRLMNVTSSCDSAVLVVAGDPSSSYLMDKLQGTMACGDRMPKGGAALTSEELGCMSGWITTLNSAGGGGDPGGGGGDPGGGGGGGGW